MIGNPLRKRFSGLGYQANFRKSNSIDRHRSQSIADGRGVAYLEAEVPDSAYQRQQRQRPQ